MRGRSHLIFSRNGLMSQAPCQKARASPGAFSCLNIRKDRLSWSIEERMVFAFRLNFVVIAKCSEPFRLTLTRPYFENSPHITCNNVDEVDCRALASITCCHKLSKGDQTNGKRRWEPQVPIVRDRKDYPRATRLGYANLDFGKLAVFITVRTIY